ncbi:hypothetical protein FBEOM_7405 [Fusarium beomiforme]|uniref:BTB domain-containing protein n=1 Tax=Fusarium beomiforme TaxID=44412 RepID=A0A9P5DXR7_9HYPO|nr:hypothetical protein FBEOM_7405 [Fusarium beomiforme]
MNSIPYEIGPDGGIELVLKEPNSLNVIPEKSWYKGTNRRNPRCDDWGNKALGGRYRIFDNFETTTRAKYDGDDNHLQATPDVVRMKVSSRHLILAAKLFCIMLTCPYAESFSTSSQSGVRQISTTSWDAKALAIVLDIIHGRLNLIPKDVGLSLLTRIATIVDYYEFHESMRLIKDKWLKETREILFQQIHLITARIH